MQEYIHLYGNQDNPYPYIKAANLFYLGSFHEAAPMVYAEAMTLGVPVLTTNTCSAEELVGEKGFVCENDENGIYKEFESVFECPQKLNEKKDEIKNYKVNNEKIIDRMNQFLS